MLTDNTGQKILSVFLDLSLILVIVLVLSFDAIVLNACNTVFAQSQVNEHEQETL